MKPIIKAMFVRRKTQLEQDEQALVEAAVLPSLSEITPELLNTVQSESKKNIMTVLEACGIFAGIFVIGLLMHSKAFCFSTAVTVALALLAAMVMYVRSGFDETASVMKIPVHHVEENKFSSAAVCYLPDGKYLFRLSKNEADPESVNVITCNGITIFKYNRKVEKS